MGQWRGSFGRWGCFLMGVECGVRMLGQTSVAAPSRTTTLPFSFS